MQTAFSRSAKQASAFQVISFPRCLRIHAENLTGCCPILEGKNPSSTMKNVPHWLWFPPGVKKSKSFSVPLWALPGQDLVSFIEEYLSNKEMVLKNSLLKGSATGQDCHSLICPTMVAICLEKAPERTLFMGRAKREKGDRELSGWAIEEKHLQHEVCWQRTDKPESRGGGNRLKNNRQYKENESGRRLRVGEPHLPCVDRELCPLPISSHRQAWRYMSHQTAQADSSER